MKPALSALVAVAILSACAARAPAPSERSEATASTASGTAASQSASAASAPRAVETLHIRTRNARFASVPFAELPGWSDDDPLPAWPAFLRSCEVLQKRPHWRELCTDAVGLPAESRQVRAFFESRFTPLSAMATSGARDGLITGYFEPLLEGRSREEPGFAVPILGTPNDLYTFDWALVPKAQRQSVLNVRPAGNRLVVASALESTSYALDLRRFVLDDRDRRLRVRLWGDGKSARAEPYYSRAELQARGLPHGVNAPVIAWTNNALSLYAMQVQGSGRIRVEGGKVLRLQYAEQNGHPFKPLPLVAKRGNSVVVRGAAGIEAADTFMLEGDEAGSGESDSAAIVTRGRAVAAASSTSATQTDALVAELLKGARASPGPAKSKVSASNASSDAIAPRLAGDPSYVFFKTQIDQTPAEGPKGALGVTLTPQRSIAVDPRVTPLGYPVFLSTQLKSGLLQTLVMAQDTGGAIRGAVRADYFWGFGHQAGQSARTTKAQGRMWVLLPNDEARQLAARRTILTRGSNAVAVEPAANCLWADGDFCTETDD